MAYIEHDQLDAQLKKLENVCAENGFTYKFLRDKYLDGDGDSYRLMRWREVAIRIYGDDDAKDIISAQRLHDKALLEIDFV